MRVVAGIIRREDQILLVHQQEPGNPASNWALPGGVVEDGEDLLTALHREIREETGLIIRDIERLAWVVEVVNAGRSSYLAFIFEVTVDDAPLTPDDPDSFILDARYVPEGEAVLLVSETLPWPEMREPLLAYLGGENAPPVERFYCYDNR